MDIEELFAKYRDTILSKRELERHLRAHGHSRSVSKIVASRCGRPMPMSIITRRSWLKSVLDRIEVY